MSIQEKVQREEIASENLTEYVAKQRTEDEWTGKAGKATVVDVETEFDEQDGVLAEFELRLPDNSTGYLSFTEWRDDLLKTLLEEEFHTSHTEMNILMEEIPVVRTDSGWEAKIGDAPLRYVFEDDKSSRIFRIDSIGMASPNRYIQYTVAILSLLPAVELGIMWLVLVALMYLGVALFLYVPLSVMLSPMSKDISTESVES